MDYACEPAVDRSTLATNQARIDATLANEMACLEAEPTLPWLPVLQGDTLAERAYDLAQRQRLGLVPTTLAGIGSVCGRGATGGGPCGAVVCHTAGATASAQGRQALPWGAVSRLWARCPGPG